MQSEGCSWTIATELWCCSAVGFSFLSWFHLEIHSFSLTVAEQWADIFLEFSVTRPRVSLFSSNRHVRGHYLVCKFRIIIFHLHHFIYMNFCFHLAFLSHKAILQFFSVSLVADFPSSAIFVTLLCFPGHLQTCCKAQFLEEPCSHSWKPKI